MGSGGRNVETEIKLRVDSVEHARRLLRRAGFRVSRRRVHEVNIVFEAPGGGLRARGQLLRLRRAGRVATLTFKGTAEAGRHKSRTELETGVADFARAEEILSALGYQPSFRYEKFRTEYTEGGAGGVACLDETPVGVYLELEGPAEWIDRRATDLGFAENQYITDSYMGLYGAGKVGSAPHRRGRPSPPNALVSDACRDG